MIFIKGAGSDALLAPGVTVDVPELDEICSGTAYLRAPLLGDVIQVGVGGTTTTGMIAVRKIRTEMTVRRTDGAVINRQQDLQQFVNTIATFSLAKQRRG
jgi:hypothetical protein